MELQQAFLFENNRLKMFRNVWGLAGGPSESQYLTAITKAGWVKDLLDVSI